MVTLKKYMLILILSTISIGSSFGQIVADENTQPATNQNTNSTESGNSGNTLSTSPWDNGATINTTSGTIISNISTDNQRSNTNDATENLNGTTGNGNAPGAPREGLRTNGTRPLQGRGPGGNPDVPFDTNMNLAFLALGLVFVVVVMKNKLVKKPATVTVK